MYGIDISEEMLKKAKEKVLDTVTLSLGDAEHLPFENGKFDCLLCTDSFHHYPTPKRAIAEFCRVLDTNGYLILADFWKPFPIRQAMNIFIPFSNEGENLHLFYFPFRVSPYFRHILPVYFVS